MRLTKQEKRGRISIQLEKISMGQFDFFWLKIENQSKVWSSERWYGGFRFWKVKDGKNDHKSSNSNLGFWIKKLESHVNWKPSNKLPVTLREQSTCLTLFLTHSSPTGIL